MNQSLWWRDGVIYQIYPRSFADSNGDGLGDLPGITAHLDYLTDLGIDAIWLSPFYPSPDADFGYDVSDYTAVDPRYGSMADFDQLLAESHRRGIRLILDLVLNHTSVQHPWFLESRTSRENPKGDWYLWQDEIPNNWQSVMGGRAWTCDSQRGQYYYHAFLKEQPDLNWRNLAVRQAQLEVVRFWLERGADGFRLDVFNAYFKDDQLRSNPAKFGLRAFDRQRHVYDSDRPEMIPLLAELRQILDTYPERYAVGETYLDTPEKAVYYCGPQRLHAAFNFDFTRRRFHPAQFQQAILNWQQVAGTDIWPNYVLSNHDMPRAATRYFKGEDDAPAKVLTALLLTQRGTPFLYYGEEIGMRDISLRRNQILDPPGKRYWPFYRGRDGCRSPMQWDDSANAGFSSGHPWLPVHMNYTHRNVTTQRNRPDSLLNFTSRLIALRREHPALQSGDFQPLLTKPQQVLVYLRQTSEQKIMVALNFREKPAGVLLSQTVGDGGWQILLSTAEREGTIDLTDRLELAPYEVCLLNSS
jgi:alpha-glucosidase